MAKTKLKGDIGTSIITADLLKRGYKIAIPYGEDWKYDLILLRNNKFERVQCKYYTSDKKVIRVNCRSCNNWSVYKYTKNDIDWIAVYEVHTNKCYYISSKLFHTGRNVIVLRITELQRKYKNKKTLYANDFLNI